MKADALSVSLPNYSARIMRDVLHRRAGIDWQVFCRQSGVGPGIFDCRNLVTAETELQLQHGFLAATANASNLWVELGLSYRAASYGSFGMTMMTANNLGDIFADCSQYQALTYSLIRYRFVSHEDGSSCLIGEDEGIGGAFRHFTQYRDLGLLRKLLQDLVGDGADIVESISIAAPPPDSWQDLAELFPCPVDFDAPVTRWRFRPGAMGVSTVMSDQNLFAASSEECARLLADIGAAATVSGQLERMLDTSDNWFPSLAEAARRFSMSERTLHRRLRDEGRSFLELVNEAKIRRAKARLSKCCVSLADVAMELGFSDASGLSRAFKRQAGMSISEFRHLQQRKQAGSYRTDH
ncbi:helix-turn-helix domain-containing protein [Sphingobium sp.]|uniref:helix-turn-helix domain-containing protein n=1 Tax=Sphingobium sp. TaxID=1912891 RepID=UPI002C6DBEEF|nr:AraC family transcriptional regulator ligand-binding domain-containing protein [Sphingobium sp.]HUD90706.1 AraC family transcriptional regulator ligand-binding domain-containing protein [Sphingobium sp.]